MGYEQEHTCKRCEKEYTAYSWNSKYCGDECRKAPRFKKWPRGKDLNLKWVRQSKHWRTLAGDRPFPEFTIFFQPCRWPDCNKKVVETNEHQYIIVSKDNDNEVACGTHHKMDYRLCENEFCKECEWRRE
tara:strand:+ start:279 stop:668 length:390 start_codon:yes stop_codon:yes gene_type:complete